MATKTATRKAPAKKVLAKKVPAKASATKKAAPATESSNGVRGRKRDPDEDARILKALLPNVTIAGEGVRSRVNGIGEASKSAGVDPTRAKMILLRHLAEKAGESVRPTPANIQKLRDEKHLSWAQIDAMTGTSRNETLKLYGEAHGDPDAWRKFHVVSRDGTEGMRTKSAPSAKSGGARKALDAKPVFSGEETRDEIVAKVEGKNITWNGSGKMEGASYKAKVASVTKVGKGKEGRVMQFNDGSKSRTVLLTAIVKVGGR
jgi:hypothetical protein